jgi:tyrosinase
MGYTYQGLEYWSLSSEQLQQNSIKLINSLYAPSGAFAKRAGVQGQTRHFIHVEIDRTQVERPCSINIFINGKPAASVPVMQQPECGTLRTSMAIDESLSGALSNASSSVENPVEVEITKVDGTIAALDHVDSLKISFEEVLVVPAKSDEEFPTLVKENTQSAHIQAYSKRSQMD